MGTESAAAGVGTGDASSRPSALRGIGQALAVIGGLASLALAQPVFDLLRRTPEFFVVRDMGRLDLAALVVLTVAAPTLLLALPAAAAFVLRPALGRPAVAATAGLLAAVVALQAGRELPAAPVALTLAVAAGAATCWACARLDVVRAFLSLVSLAAVVVPATLVMDPEVRRSTANPYANVAWDGPDTGIRAPIVMVVFDEWALTSALDADGQIDSGRLPNLARFAERATWYPNATAAADTTEYALPAMLSGIPPKRDLLPNATDYSPNLCTILAPSHEVFANEPITALCPPELNRLAPPRPGFGERFGLLASDLYLVWLHRTLPSAWAEDLPPVNENWSGFATPAPPAAAPPTADEPVARALLHLFRTDRAAEFRSFVEAIEPRAGRPGFYLLHSLLPHGPTEYLPSGKAYHRSRSGRPGIEGDLWVERPWPALHDYKRHLMQVGFVDRLIGELVARLEATGLFDESLIVLVADHGIAFQPGESPRLLIPDRTPAGQVLDVATVPLLIKAPFQEAPETDERAVSLVDLPALVLDAAGATVETLDPPPPDDRQPEPLVIFGKYAGATPVPAARESWRRSRVAELTELLGEAGDPLAIGAVPDLHGQRLSELDIRPASVSVQLVSPGLWYHVDLAQPVLPALVDAVFEEDAQLRDRRVAVAFEGVIGATVETHEHTDGRHRFAALLPERLLRHGQNRVDVLLVSDGPDGIELEHVDRPDSNFVWELSMDAEGVVGAVVLRSPSAHAHANKRFPVARQETTSLLGFLNGGYSVHGGINGWVVDQEQPGAIDAVAGFLGDTLFGTAPLALDRPDVARRYTNDHLHSGFLLRPSALTVPKSPNHLPNDEIEDRLRREGVAVYAMSRRGLAIRLRHAYRPLEAESGGEVLPVTDGRRLPVRPNGHGLGGAIDVAARAEDGRMRVEGWAADLERSEPPRAIVVYRDGEFLTTLPGKRPRPDVAEHHGAENLLLTGFRGGFRVPADKPLAERHRIFALMQRGVAVELAWPEPGPAGRTDGADAR